MSDYPKFKMMIQAETAKEFRSKILELAESYTGVQTNESPSVDIVSPRRLKSVEDEDVVARALAKIAVPTMYGTMAPTGTEMREGELTPHQQQVSDTISAQTGNVIADGKEWRKVPGTNGYEGVPLKSGPPVDMLAPGSSDGPVNSDLDSEGNPYDIRIHSANRAVTTKGTWKYKRGTPDAFIEQVEAELRHRKSTHGVLGAVAPAPLPSVPEAKVKVEMPNFGPTAPVVSTPVSIPTPSQPVQNGVYDLKSFREQLPNILMTLINSKKIDENYIQSLRNYFGVNEIWMIAKDEAKSKELFDNFVSYGLVTRV